MDAKQRLAVLARLKANAFNKQRYSISKCNSTEYISKTTNIGYVLGRYDNDLGIYEYYNGTTWTTPLSTFTQLFKECDTDILKVDKSDKKGCKYAISKVFYIELHNSKGNKSMAVNNSKIIVEIKLTKMNHYQILTEITNTI